MMQLLHRLSGSATPMYGAGERSKEPMAGIGPAVVDSGVAERARSKSCRRRAVDRRQFEYRPGQPIARPLSPSDAAVRFVTWMRSQNFCGEYLWRDLLEYFAWFVTEERLVPLPEQHRAMFAHELAKLCPRGQVRMTENGRRRRLTTYFVPAPPAELAAA